MPSTPKRVKKRTSMSTLQLASGLSYGSGGDNDVKKAEDEEKSAPHLNLVLVGDGAVGKTSICDAFMDGTQPSPIYEETTGLNIHEKNVYSPARHRGHIKLRIWDASAKVVGSRLATNYLFYADAILLVYDVSHIGSFINLSNWLNLIYRVFETDESIPSDVRNKKLPLMVLIGNKGRS